MTPADDLGACAALLTEAITLAAKTYQLYVVVSLVECRDALPASPDQSPDALRIALAVFGRAQEAMGAAGTDPEILQRLQQAKALLIGARDRHARH
jgi:hypothetical protein